MSISFEFIREFERAVRDPFLYRDRAKLEILRNSFDGACEQFHLQLVGSAEVGRSNIRASLLSLDSSSLPPREQRQLKAFLAALKACDRTLFVGRYSSEPGLVEQFITNELRVLAETL